MKRTLCLLALSLALGACGPAYVTAGPAYPAEPGYVYVYADGGCWADDVWYGACPWYGGQVGYYYRYDRHYYRHPQIVWQHRHRPPPRVRDHRPPSRHHMVPPPRVRDHRHRHRR